MDRVECIVYSQVRGREVIMGPKINTLKKHDGKRQTKMDLPHIDVKNDESYVNKKCGNLRAATICNSQARATPLCCNK